jgi:hypothetical protein
MKIREENVDEKATKFNETKKTKKKKRGIISQYIC